MVNKIVVWDSLVIMSIDMGGPLTDEGALEELAPTKLYIKYTVQIKPAPAVQKSRQ